MSNGVEILYIEIHHFFTLRKYYSEFSINAFNNHWTISKVPLSKASYERDICFIHWRNIFFHIFSLRNIYSKELQKSTTLTSSWRNTMKLIMGSKKYQVNVMCPKCFLKPRLYLRNDANFDLCYEIYSNLMQFTLYNPRNFIIIWCKNRTLTQFLQFHYYLMTQ